MREDVVTVTVIYKLQSTVGSVGDLLWSPLRTTRRANGAQGFLSV